MAKGVRKPHLLEHGPDRPVDDIHSAWHDHTSDKLNPMPLGLYVNLIRVQGQMKILLQPRCGFLVQYLDMLNGHTVCRVVIHKTRIMLLGVFVAKFPNPVQYPFIEERKVEVTQHL